MCASMSKGAGMKVCMSLSVKVWVRKWIWIGVSVCISKNRSMITAISVDMSLVVSLSNSLIMKTRISLNEISA